MHGVQYTGHGVRGGGGRAIVNPFESFKKSLSVSPHVSVATGISLACCRVCASAVWRGLCAQGDMGGGASHPFSFRFEIITRGRMGVPLRHPPVFFDRLTDSLGRQASAHSAHT